VKQRIWRGTNSLEDQELENEAIAEMDPAGEIYQRKIREIDRADAAAEKEARAKRRRVKPWHADLEAQSKKWRAEYERDQARSIAERIAKAERIKAELGDNVMHISTIIANMDAIEKKEKEDIMKREQRVDRLHIEVFISQQEREKSMKMENLANHEKEEAKKRFAKRIEAARLETVKGGRNWVGLLADVEILKSGKTPVKNGNEKK
jgi:hypothetical protein